MGEGDYARDRASSVVSSKPVCVHVSAFSLQPKDGAYYIVRPRGLAVRRAHVVLVQINTCRAKVVSHAALGRGVVENRAVVECGCSCTQNEGHHVPIVAAAVVGCRGGGPSSLVSQSLWSSCTLIFRLECTERVASLGVLARLALSYS